ncbi:unnamed protein product, partial [Didymodactylos carnosus]
MITHKTTLMSRRKQTNPKACKREASEDEPDEPCSKKKATEQNNVIAPENFECNNSNETIRTPGSDDLLNDECEDDFDDEDKADEESSIFNNDELLNSELKCGLCQQSFYDSEEWNHHRLYECQFITGELGGYGSPLSDGQTLDDYSNQLDNVSHGNGPTTEYPYSCTFCEKSYTNMALLLKHEQVHADLMPFRCTYCGKGFKHRRSLNRHSKLHTGEKKFKCLFCDSSFARSDHLKAHARTHNNDKPFQCHICSCGYNSQAALKVHLSHSHSKPKFKCLNCCKEFESNNALDEHIYTYHKIQPTDKSKQCPCCPRVCLGEESLRCHISEEHSSILRKSDEQAEENNHNDFSTNSSIDNGKTRQTNDCDVASVFTVCPKVEQHSPVLSSSPPPPSCSTTKSSHFNKLPSTLFNDTHYLSAALYPHRIIYFSFY